MSRVTIDQKAWPGILQVAQRLKVNTREVAGLLASLYRTTQEKKLISISHSKFADYAETWDLSDEQNEELIKALIWRDFLSEGEDGELIIVGNEKHISGILATRERSRKNGLKGGRPSKKLDQGKVNPPASSKNPVGYENNPAGLEKKPIQNSTVQYSSEQYNTNQSSADQPASGSQDAAASFDFNWEDEATPESIQQLWRNIVEPQTAVPAGDLSESVRSELDRSLEEMPFHDAWIKYFYKIAKSDWSIKRRETFHFRTVVKWSNIVRETQDTKHPAKALEDYDYNQETA